MFSLLSIVSNPITQFVFKLDETNGNAYSWGFGMYLLYATAMFYLILAFIMSFKSRDISHKPQRFLASLFLFASATSVLFQILLPKTLLIGFVTTLSIVIMYLNFQHPEDYTDSLTGILFNRNAFIFKISEKIKEKKPFAAIGIYVDDYDHLFETYSQKALDNNIFNLAVQLNNISATSNTYRLDPMSFVIVLENDAVDNVNNLIYTIRQMFQQPYLFDSTYVRLTATLCCLYCPQDAEKLEEIADILDTSVNEARKRGKNNIIFAKDHILNRERKIEELTRQKLLLEEMTRQAKEAREEAERANNAKGIFLANMSHEIRTPMNAILGISELVLKQDINNEVKESIENIKSAGTSLLSIINDILDFSKIESGNFELIEENYYIDQLRIDAINIIAGKADEKGLKLNSTINDTIPCQLIGDQVRLRQIFINLLNNAVKFTNKGSVTLNIDYKWQGTTFLLCCSVTDTGIGIKRDGIERIFKSFQRLDTRQNRSIEGTGLGLAISKNLLENMGGEIHVESEYGKGSTFSFVVPQKIADKTPLKQNISPSRSDKIFTEGFTAPDAHILIVDDNRLNLTVAKGLLKTYKVHTDTAKSGMECLDLVKQNYYDIIFMDHMMPEMDGIDTMKLIRQMDDKKAASTPIIALTANAVSGMKEMFLNAGFEGFISKPIDITVLDSTLHQYLPPEYIQVNN